MRFGVPGPIRHRAQYASFSLDDLLKSVPLSRELNLRQLWHDKYHEVNDERGQHCRNSRWQSISKRTDSWVKMSRMA